MNSSKGGMNELSCSIVTVCPAARPTRGKSAAAAPAAVIFKKSRRDWPPMCFLPIRVRCTQIPGRARDATNYCVPAPAETPLLCGQIPPQMPVLGTAPSRRRAGRGGRPKTARRPLEPVFVFDHLPERVLVDDLVALECVDVAALVIEVFAVAALAAHGPYRNRPVGRRQDVFLVFPAHVGNLLEAVGQRLADRRPALECAADRLRPARQAEYAVLVKTIDDALDSAAVERGRNLPHAFDRHRHLALLRVDLLRKAASDMERPSRASLREPRTACLRLPSRPAFRSPGTGGRRRGAHCLRRFSPCPPPI